MTMSIIELSFHVIDVTFGHYILYWFLITFIVLAVDGIENDQELLCLGQINSDLIAYS